MEKLLRFDIAAYEQMVNQPQNGGKIETVKDPALFYINEEITLGDISKYEVSAKIGRGRYSEVYSGVEKNTNNKVIVKILKPINKTKINQIFTPKMENRYSNEKLCIFPNYLNYTRYIIKINLTSLDLEKLN